jgi:glycerophosphoryl diester phosphodiesterase
MDRSVLLTGLLLASLVPVGCAPRRPAALNGPSSAGRVLVLAHRGASAARPEHSLAAYELAHAQGADLIEPDLVCSRDGVLVCLHDLTLERVTDVGQRFPGRARADGRWYAADLDWSELEVLRCGAGGDGSEGGAGSEGHGLVRLDDMLALFTRLNQESGRTVGFVPEPKRPAWHAAQGLDLIGPTRRALLAWSERNPGAPVVVQCFEREALGALADPRAVGGDEGWPLVWNLSSPLPGPEELGALCSGLDGIGLSRKAFEGEDAPGPKLLERARTLGLMVVVWTFRGDEEGLARFLGRFPVDGVFADDPDVAIRARGRAAAARSPERR